MILWDTVFAYDNEVTLIDYVAVAMIVLIKDKITESDSNGVFSLLFNYPKETNLNDIIQTTLQFAEGKGNQNNNNKKQNTTSTTSTTITPKKQKSHRRKSQNNYVPREQRDQEIEKRIDMILTTFQNSLLQDSEIVSKLPDTIFLSLAELKQIKLVLGNTLPLEGLTPLEELKEQLQIQS